MVASQKSISTSKGRQDKDDKPISRVGQGANSVIMRLLQRLKNNAINELYAKETMAILFDLGVKFPRFNTQLELKEGLIEQLENASFQDKHLSMDRIRRETNNFLKEISKDNSFVAELFEHKLDDEGKPIIPVLDEDQCWRVLTAVNRCCGEFTDLYVNLKDDIPIRRNDGWMNELYLDFLEEGVNNAATIWQIERIRENFDAIKELRDESIAYFHKMKGVVNDKFLISIKKEIDRAPSSEKLNQINDNFYNSRAAIEILQKHKEFKQKLKFVQTYEDVLKLLTSLTAEINKKKKRSPGLLKSLFE